MVRLIALAVLSLSIADRPSPAPVAAKETRKVDCVRLSGDQIGQLPLSIRVGAQPVEFVEWKALEITASTLIGFTAQASPSLRFTVEAGGRQFSTGSNWIHPAGVVGPQVKPISAITICNG